MLQLSAVLLVALGAGSPGPTAAVTPAGAPAVRILRQSARWTGLAGPDPLSDETESLFLISGELRNGGRRPIAYVKLGFELLDDAGLVLASEYGYNRKAEDLRRPDYEAGHVSRDRLHIEPLAPGATDAFRMIFFRSDVPRFEKWRVRVMEVGYE
jgi:hypothetical protein